LVLYCIFASLWSIIDAFCVNRRQGSVITNQSKTLHYEKTIDDNNAGGLCGCFGVIPGNGYAIGRFADKERRTTLESYYERTCRPFIGLQYAEGAEVIFI
jgi:hypothetical protein